MKKESLANHTDNVYIQMCNNKFIQKNLPWLEIFTVERRFEYNYYTEKKEEDIDIYFYKYEDCDYPDAKDEDILYWVGLPDTEELLFYMDINFRNFNFTINRKDNHYTITAFYDIVFKGKELKDCLLQLIMYATNELLWDFEKKEWVQ